MKKLFIIFILILTGQVNAKTKEYKGNCDRFQFKHEIEACLEAELTSLDKKLNILYRQQLKYDHREILKISEINWIKYKEKDCEYIASVVNEGLQFKAIHLACLIKKTRTRISELDRPALYGGWFEKPC